MAAYPPGSVGRRSSSRRVRRLSTIEDIAAREQEVLRVKLDEVGAVLGKARAALERHRAYASEVFGKPHYELRLTEVKKTQLVHLLYWLEAVLVERLERHLAKRKELNLKVFGLAKLDWGHLDAEALVFREIFARWKLMARCQKQKDFATLKSFNRIFQSTISASSTTFTTPHKSKNGVEARDSRTTIADDDNNDDDATVFTAPPPAVARRPRKPGVTKTKRRRRKPQEDDAGRRVLKVAAVGNNSVSTAASWRPAGVHRVVEPEHSPEHTRPTIIHWQPRQRFAALLKPTRNQLDSAVDFALRRQMLHDAQAIKRLLTQKRDLHERIAASKTIFDKDNDDDDDDRENRHRGDPSPRRASTSSLASRPPPLASRPPFEI